MPEDNGKYRSHVMRFLREEDDKVYLRIETSPWKKFVGKDFALTINQYNFIRESEPNAAKRFLYSPARLAGMLETYRPKAAIKSRKKLDDKVTEILLEGGEDSADFRLEDLGIDLNGVDSSPIIDDKDNKSDKPYDVA